MISHVLLIAVTLSLSSPEDYTYTIPVCTNRIDGHGMGKQGDYNTVRAEDWVFLQEAFRERAFTWLYQFTLNTIVRPEIGHYSLVAESIDTYRDSLFRRALGISTEESICECVNPTFHCRVLGSGRLTDSPTTWDINGKKGFDFVTDVDRIHLCDTNNFDVIYFATGLPTKQIVTNAYALLERYDTALCAYPIAFYERHPDSTELPVDYVYKINTIGRNQDTSTPARYENYVYTSSSGNVYTNRTLVYYPTTDYKYNYATTNRHHNLGFTKNEQKMVRCMNRYGLNATSDDGIKGKYRINYTASYSSTTKETYDVIGCREKPFVFIPVRHADSNLLEDVECVIAVYLEREIQWEFYRRGTDGICNNLRTTSNAVKRVALYRPVQIDKIETSTSLFEDALAYELTGWNLVEYLAIADRNMGTIDDEPLAAPEPEARNEFSKIGFRDAEAYIETYAVVYYITTVNAEVFTRVKRRWRSHVVIEE